MANEKALFEDDFSSDFDDVFTDDLAANDSGDLGSFDELVAQPVQRVEEFTPRPMLQAASPALTMPEPAGGDAVLPAISIFLFYEREDTREMMQVCARDRRMGRATLNMVPGGIQAAIAHLRVNPTPNLLIIESTAHSIQIINDIDALAEHCDEQVKVMVIGSVNDIMLYRQLVARGVSEYLVPPMQPLHVIRSISNLFTDPDAPFVGRQISVVGAKGGVGASTIAHNLAWSLAENVKLNTTLVDLDLSFGTTALDFNQDTPQTVADALLAPERADEAVIERLMARATERLSLFTAPGNFNNSEQLGQVSDEAYAMVVSTVRRKMPYMILDLPHLWNSWLRNTLIASDEVIIVCQPDLASLRNGKNLIDQLKGHRINDTPPRLVLNMVGVPKRPEVPVKDFAQAIGAEPEIVVPFEPELFGRAANNGQMVSETDPNSKAAAAIDHLASALTGRVVAPAKKSFIKKILGK